MRFFDIFAPAMKSRTIIDTLSCRIPRGVIEAAFCIMIAAAICSWHSINEWMLAHIPVVLGLVNTVGMVILYYAIMRGMKPLEHPLTVLWWIVIGVNLAGFVIYCIGDAAHGVSAITATALPLVYLPLGILIYVWYRGHLGQAGLWMVIRILVVNLIPVLFYMAGLLECSWGIVLMEVLTIGVDICYAWALRRVLV